MSDYHDESPEISEQEFLSTDQREQVAKPEPDITYVPFEELTLGEALRYFVLRPVEVGRQWWRVLTYDPVVPRRVASPVVTRARVEAAVEDESEFVDERAERSASFAVRSRDVEAPAAARLPHEHTAEEAEPLAAEVQVPERMVELVVWAVAMLSALRGGLLLRHAALDLIMHRTQDPGSSLVWLALAVALATGVELWRSREWWAERWPGVEWLARRSATVPPRVILTFAAIIGLLLTVIGAGGPGGWFGAFILFVLAGALWLTAVMVTRRLAVAEVIAARGAGVSGESNLWEDVPGEVSDDGAYVVRSVVRTPAPVPTEGRVWRWAATYIYQLALIPLALVASGLTYNLNVRADAAGRAVDVVLTTPGLIAWISSVVLWVLVLGVDVRRLSQNSDTRVNRRLWYKRLAALRVSWVLPALVAITVLGAAIRLHDLGAVPPEMTSDHIEKLLDGLRVSEGYHAVFFPNNGGREGFQMYVVALVAKLPGVGFSFDALKLATALEGILTLPVLWWMARQVFGTETRRDRQLGDWVGVTLAGLVAISSWHLMLSRLGLRIVLTPFTTALVIGFLARVMRHHRMRDWLALGVVLGAGVYFYQANRMLPLVALAGTGLALLATIRAPRDVGTLLWKTAGLGAVAALPVLVYVVTAQLLAGATNAATSDFGVRMGDVVPLVAMVWFAAVSLTVARREDPVLRIGGGLLAATVVALALYIPMYHYSTIQPDQFWNRTRGRLFGEQAFVRTDPVTDQRVTYEPDIREQIDRLWDGRDVFADNYADALRMYHWEGDAAWISNPGGFPALDGIAGGLLALGAAMWVVWAIRRRDVVFVLVPVAVLVMLLPSAMTLAYTIENPSFTRASGTLPSVFLLAALPLGVLAVRLARLPWRLRTINLGGVVAAVVLVGVLWSAAGTDWDVFYKDYRLQYAYSWKPYAEISQPMRRFAEGGGSYGNAFMVAYPHWLDHRILGTMAGDIRWPNGLVSREQLFQQIAANAGTPYAYDPSKPLFVMSHPDDADTRAWLHDAFPGGELELYTYQYDTQVGMQMGEFYVYRVLAGPIE